MRVLRTFLVIAAMASLSACAGGPPETMSPAAPPPSAEALSWQIQAAERALEDGSTDEAGQMFARILASAPDDPRALLGVGELKLALGEPREAGRLFDQLTGNPEVAARAEQGRGLALLQTDRRDSALESLTKAVELDPSLWRAWNAIGHLHDRAGRWVEARAAYEQALAASPFRAGILNNMGFSLVLQRQWGEAAELLSQAVHLKPDFELARNNLRLALAWQGRYVEALSGVQRDKMAIALNNVGYAAMMRGDLAAAEGYLLRAIETSPAFFEPAALNLLQLDSLKGKAE